MYIVEHYGAPLPTSKEIKIIIDKSILIGFPTESENTIILKGFHQNITAIYLDFRILNPFENSSKIFLCIWRIFWKIFYYNSRGIFKRILFLHLSSYFTTIMWLDIYNQNMFLIFI